MEGMMYPFCTDLVDPINQSRHYRNVVDISAEQVLDEAKEIIAQPGAWTQHQYQNQSTAATSFCSMGVIKEVYKRHGIHDITDYNPASRALGSVLNLGGTGIVLWNDLPERSQDQVVESFEKARAYAAEKGM